VEIRRVGAGGDDPFAAQRAILAGSEVRTILDVGAARGQSAQRYLRLFPEATIHSFEPGAESFAALMATIGSERQVNGHQVAVGDVAGEATFYLNRASETNSLLPSLRTGDRYFDAALTEPVGSTTVPVVTLDGFCRSVGAERVDVLKMDIQGAELRALRGAETLLHDRRIRLIYTEVLFAPLYDGQTSFGDVAGYLDGHGYRCYGLYDLRRGRNGTLVQADVIYIAPDLEATLRSQH
jgi:FkbM family methyltransferase